MSRISNIDRAVKMQEKIKQAIEEGKIRNI